MTHSNIAVSRPNRVLFLLCFQMVRNLTNWMDDLLRQMVTSEKPRDVSGVELLMNNHQGHKAEIDARDDNFGECISLGKELLSRSHYASNEIKEKLKELTGLRNTMLHRWEERYYSILYFSSL